MLTATTSNKSFLPLNKFSKIILYKKFSFYNLQSILPAVGTFGKISHSWLDLLFTNYFTYTFRVKSSQILRTRAVFFASNYMYMDLGNKYTILKPKFKSFFTSRARCFLKKELLILSSSYFFSFLGFSFLKFLNSQFLPYMVTKSYPVDKKVFFHTRLFLRKIVFFQNSLSKYFFFSKVFKNNFSLYQKKINFLQFTIFFKNITIPSS